MRNLILPFILLLTFVFSCRENDADEGLEQKNASYDVYVAGSENDKACYWKNNVLNYLSNGDNIQASKIIIENNNIYVFGIKYISANNTEYYFWKNNVKYDLKNYLGIPSTSKAYFSDFIVRNNIELFAGYVDNISSGTPNIYSLCYWKNGVKTVLQNNVTFPYRVSIDFYNNTVYCGSPTGYYKNNTFNSLSGEWGQNFAQNNNGIHHLFISNNNKNLNCYNTDNNSLSFVNTTTLYPNLSVAKLIFDTYTNDLYTFSAEIDNLYFKNNITINFVDSQYKRIEDMKVLNNNLYMIRSFSTLTSLPLKQYKVFINNVQTQYISGNNGSFNSIYVVQN
ncbi:hypothetical protein [Chryseobacterium sp. GP-SGM7]|uniref:hypothetical protein n=1 Tax=Chryseobacterium sp. GP-SGM7 TaxID=3411323 RepID=UPI003B961D1F